MPAFCFLIFAVCGVGSMICPCSTGAQGISKDRALALAQQTEVVKAFYDLKQGALKNCIRTEVVRPCESHWVTCIEDAWVVKFSVGEECIQPYNEQLGVTLLINGKEGGVISQYPEIAYFQDPLFCRDSPDCRLSVKSARPACKNFIYALAEDPLSVNSERCLCRDSGCRLFPPNKISGK